MTKINSSCYSKGHISAVAISFLLCELECLLNIIIPGFIASVFSLESHSSGLMIVEKQN